MSGTHHAAASGASVTTSLMTLHITPHAERLPATSVGALERLLARVRMAVNLQA